MTKNRPWEDVAEDSYFRGVLGNIHHRGGLGLKAEIRVRFGTTGDGVCPNYQLEGSNGRVIRFSGRSHKEFHESQWVTFDPDRISGESFSIEDVKSMIARCKAAR